MIFETTNIKLLLSALLLVSHCKAQRFHPEICQRISANSTTYNCKKVTDCSSAKAIINSGKAVLCGLEDRIHKICCPVIRTKNNSNQNAQKVVWEKCKEYSTAMNVAIKIPGQTVLDPDDIQIRRDCKVIEELIVNGAEAVPKEFPHMALIGYGDAFKFDESRCGGSLISERFILSAAHCAKTARGNAKWALLGDLDIASRTDDTKPKLFKITEIITHPGYKPPAIYNDIALFKLNATVSFSPYIRPICLYTTPIPETELKASITGWGRIETGFSTSSHLLKTTISFIPESTCKTAYDRIPEFPKGFDSKSMICAGDLISGNDTCGGDSGGPLQIPVRNMVCMWAEVGVTSTGSIFCGDRETPAVYTRVSNYIDWIQPIVWP